MMKPETDLAVVWRTVRIGTLPRIVSGFQEAE